MSKPTIAVVGLGYIGLPTAALIASKGLSVRGIDVNEEIIATLEKKEVHIQEPDLDQLITKVIDNGTFVPSTEIQEADIWLIAVPTPMNEEKKANMQYIDAAISAIIPHLRKNDLIIIESTSPIGTTQRCQEMIVEARPELSKIKLAYCPERVMPGQILKELEANDRIVGGLNSDAAEAAAKFYKQFVKGSIHCSDAKTAEMCKLAENASRDVNIAFANELSMIAAEAGISSKELIELANRHPRVNILNPGPGVGGHCIAIDPWFLVEGFPEQSQLIQEARAVNTKKTQWVIEKIEERIKEKKKQTFQPKIACLGLSYKPNSDDLRESPAVEITLNLMEKGHDVIAVEPHITEHPRILITDMKTALSTADILVILVAHDAFKQASIPTSEFSLDFSGAK